MRQICQHASECLFFCLTILLAHEFYCFPFFAVHSDGKYCRKTPIGCEEKDSLIKFKETCFLLSEAQP
jgi:hypothetical protein